MNVDDSLKGLSLDELLELFSDATKQLLKSKINNENADSIESNKGLVDKIQKAIIAKRAENPPLK